MVAGDVSIRSISFGFPLPRDSYDCDLGVELVSFSSLFICLSSFILSFHSPSLFFQVFLFVVVFRFLIGTFASFSVAFFFVFFLYLCFSPFLPWNLSSCLLRSGSPGEDSESRAPVGQVVSRQYCFRSRNVSRVDPSSPEDD